MVRDAGILRGAFGLGVLRTMRGSLKRFVALATICALGVTMICGLKVACIDLRASADAFFDVQDLFDLRVQSTLGITDDDVAALAALEGDTGGSALLARRQELGVRVRVVEAARELEVQDVDTREDLELLESALRV